MTRRRYSEQQIQRALFDHLSTTRRPDCFYFRVPNGGYRKPIEATILQGLGVRAGVAGRARDPQRPLLRARTKEAEGGRATPKQLEAIAAMEAAGAYCCIAEGLDRALAVLEQWGLLRGTAA